MTQVFDDPAKVCILSGRFTRSEFLHSWNHYAYAKQHGYTYISCDWPTTAQNRYMTKFFYIKHYINLFDYVFWIDDDAFFIDLKQPLDRFIPAPGKLASFCGSPANKKIFTYLSSGQCLMRGGQASETFIDRVIATPLDKVKDWWRDDLGMFTNGDQDAIVYVVHEDPDYRDCIELYDYMDFNSRIGDLEENPDKVFLLHFTGPRERKIADAAKAAKLLGCGPALLPLHVQDDLLGGRSLRSVLRSMEPADSDTQSVWHTSPLKLAFRRVFGKKSR
jgi:hypothetical protein